MAVSPFRNVYCFEGLTQKLPPSSLFFPTIKSFDLSELCLSQVLLIQLNILAELRFVPLRKLNDLPLVCDSDKISRYFLLPVWGTGRNVNIQRGINVQKLTDFRENFSLGYFTRTVGCLSGGDVYVFN